ncbi:MAG TPA: hypothetical protein PLD55_13415, partial [bacterium]|nr:hypothetical protein [bacterium]
NLFGPVTDHAQELLISKNPGAVRWPQNEAFSHYLHLMHSFSNDINNIQKNQRAEYITDFFKQRSDVIKELQKSGFSFGDRGFENACDWTIAALSAFLNDRKLQIAKI